MYIQKDNKEISGVKVDSLIISIKAKENSSKTDYQIKGKETFQQE